VKPSFLVVLLVLHNREKAVDIYNVEVEGEERTGTKKKPLLNQGKKNLLTACVLRA